MRSRPSNQAIIDYFEAPIWKLFTKSLFEKSVTCASDLNKLLPFKKLLETDFQLIVTGSQGFKEFQQYFSKYADFSLISIPMTADGTLPKVVLDKKGDHPVAVILLDAETMTQEKDHQFIASVNGLSKEMELVLVNFGDPKHLAFFEKNITLLQVYERNKWTERYAAQALFGGVNVNGRLPITVSEELPLGASEYIYKSRVGFNGPEAAGIAPERLVGIDAITQTAIKNRVFPVAKWR